MSIAKRAAATAPCVTQLGAHGKRREGENTDKDGVDVVLLADLAGFPAGALLLTLGRLPLRLLLPFPRLLLLLPHPLPAGVVGPIKDMGSGAQFCTAGGEGAGIPRGCSSPERDGRRLWATGRRAAAAARGEREKKNGKTANRCERRRAVFRLPGLFTDSFSARCWAGFFFLFIFQRVHGHDYAGALGRAAHETGFRFTPYVLNYNYKSFHK